jgi:solute carrier family 13 (sodium-dependent dicarboxylate transporter), member 2/3/5
MAASGTMGLMDVNEIPDGQPCAARAGASVRQAMLLLLALSLAVLVHGLAPFDDPARRGLALLVFVGVLWLTEALPLPVAALVVPVGAMALGLSGAGSASAFVPFADPIVFLFLGGFALAAGLRAQGLDRKMARALLALSRGHLGWSAVWLFVATAVLSMGISNTATAALMLPMALGMLRALDVPVSPGTRAFVVLGVAYSASIGGIGTLVGSPPNAIAARAAGIGFSEWLRIGLPLVAMLLPLMGLTLWLVLRPALRHRLSLAADPEPWSRQQWITVGVFLGAALGWILGAGTLKAWGIGHPDSFVAVVAAIAVVTLGGASWEQVRGHIDWGVLLLFGGGLALGQVLEQSGASLALGAALAEALRGLGPVAVMLAVAGFMVLLSEFASNTAAAALMVPVFATLATHMGLGRETVIVLVGLCASLGFALPVATPPNAMAYATGLVSQRQMLWAGMALNGVGVAVLVLWGLAA